MTVRFTGEIEFCMHQKHHLELQNKISEWFPEKNILLTGNTLEMDDVFEESEKMQLIFWFIEKNGKINDAYIETDQNQHIEDVGGCLYTCDREKFRLKSLKPLAEELESAINDNLIIAMFDLFSGFPKEKMLV